MIAGFCFPLTQKGIGEFLKFNLNSPSLCELQNRVI